MPELYWAAAKLPYTTIKEAIFAHPTLAESSIIYS
jgi:hypothetical protein